ncbi:MAG: quinoprotein dehydrogenase-associated SoxYZ-like carrier [Alphaproteobacteria bacterium]|nr:quinoprotein dehydrogenase-associated SoxYZ-like carrier [Rhodospirillales bacterium]MCW9045448.1 quinoprotein dehydrogenase-associated SoxYZ-like carrier [Alphaproteobacteria bacterium]
MTLSRILFLAFFSFFSTSALATTEVKDPLNSPMWDYMVEQFFKDVPWKFDDRVKVITPKVAEDSARVPVSVRAEGIGKVEEMIVIVDLSPFPKVAHYYPMKTEPYLELRLKLNEASAIRAAAKTSDGVWHIGGMYVDGAGGGCAAPRIKVAGPGWADNLGKVQGRLWKRKNGTERIRVRVMHPMDTGLVNNIPAFYIETLSITDQKGALLARLDSFEPVAANPVFSFEIKGGHGGYALKGRDNNGNDFRAIVLPKVK